MAKSLYIYKIERISGAGYDEFDAAIVMAYDEDGARDMFCDAGAFTRDDLTVERFGIVEDMEVNDYVILQSFNAG